MLGGHLDSWHSATGATDNAIGCATMMEAARILKAIGVKPRRTIRVACWGGEEEGLLGSQAYVKKHFGTSENPEPRVCEVRWLFQHRQRNGQGRALSVFGPPEAAAVLREALAPFSDLGFAGVTAKSGRQSRRDGQHVIQCRPACRGSADIRTRSSTFNVTWHTNLDTYERIIEPDVKSRRSFSPPPFIRSRCVTRCCRDSSRPTCQSHRHAPTPTPHRRLRVRSSFL